VLLQDFPSYDCRTEEKADQEEEKDPLDYSWDDVMGATAWSSPTLTAHFPDLFDDQMLKQMIQSTFELKDEPEVSCLTQEELQSTDWIEQSKEAWEPIQVETTTPRTHPSRLRRCETAQSFSWRFHATHSSSISPAGSLTGQDKSELL